MRNVFGFLGTLAIFAGTLSAQTMFPYSAPVCGKEGVIKSTDAGGTIQPVLKNKTNKTVRFYWLDREGKRTGGGVIKPGEGYNFGTVVGHQFVFTNAEDGTCMTIRSFQEAGDHDLVFLPNGTGSAPGLSPTPAYSVVKLTTIYSPAP